MAGKTQLTAPFKIHLIEGKFLKQQLLLFPDIIIKYFASDDVRLVRSFLSQWISHHIFPSVKALYDLYKRLDFGTLNAEELGFLWLAYCQSEEALDDYIQIEDLEPINSDNLVPFDFLIPHLKKVQNWDYPVMKPEESERFFDLLNLLGQATYDPQNSSFSFASIHYEIEKDERLQVLLVKENGILEVRIGSGEPKRRINSMN